MVEQLALKLRVFDCLEQSLPNRLYLKECWLLTVEITGSNDLRLFQTLLEVYSEGDNLGYSPKMQ